MEALKLLKDQALRQKIAVSPSLKVLLDADTDAPVSALLRTGEEFEQKKKSVLMSKVMVVKALSLLGPSVTEFLTTRMKLPRSVIATLLNPKNVRVVVTTREEAAIIESMEKGVAIRPKSGLAGVVVQTILNDLVLSLVEELKGAVLAEEVAQQPPPSDWTKEKHERLLERMERERAASEEALREVMEDKMAETERVDRLMEDGSEEAARELESMRKDGSVSSASSSVSSFSSPGVSVTEEAAQVEAALQEEEEEPEPETTQPQTPPALDMPSLDEQDKFSIDEYINL